MFKLRNQQLLFAVTCFFYIEIIELVQELYMSLYAFHLGKIMSTVLGQVDHNGQDGNAARTPIWDETSETGHTQK